MFRKFALFVSLLLVGTISFATPARAADWHNCPLHYVCLYQWTGYGAPPGDANPGWKTTFYNLRNQLCINLTSSYWPNGTKVWDNSAALIVGGSSAYSNLDYVSFYNSANCNSGTGIVSYNASWVTGESDLHNVLLAPGVTAYHTIASVGWHESGPPPSSN